MSLKGIAKGKYEVQGKINKLGYNLIEQKVKEATEASNTALDSANKAEEAYLKAHPFGERLLAVESKLRGMADDEFNAYLADSNIFIIEQGYYYDRSGMKTANSNYTSYHLSVEKTFDFFFDGLAALNPTDPNRDDTIHCESLYLNIYQNGVAAVENARVREIFSTEGRSNDFPFGSDRMLTAFEGELMIISVAKKNPALEFSNATIYFDGEKYVEGFNLRTNYGSLGYTLTDNVKFGESQKKTITDLVSQKFGESLNIDQYFDENSKKPQSGRAVSQAVDMGVARAIYAALNPEVHEAYFKISSSGVISLKDDYLNGGSKNAELPEFLVIPDMVGTTAVSGLTNSMFEGNKAIKWVVLPKSITTIPLKCFKNAVNLVEVYNTENITTLGKAVFNTTRLRRAYFPNLTSFDTGAFINCPELIYADIGKATTIPNQGFECCNQLNVVKGGKNLTAIGSGAFVNTYCLREVEAIQSSNISVYTKAFVKSRLPYDWWSRDDITYYCGATPRQWNVDNLTDKNEFKYWEEVQIPNENKINPVPTLFNQHHPNWNNSIIGGSNADNNRLYDLGCATIVLFEAYCGLYGKTFNSPFEVEKELNALYSGWQNFVTNRTSVMSDYASAIGLKATPYSEFNAESLNALYTALAEGKYAIIGVPNSGDITYTDSTQTAIKSMTLSHAVLAYGIKADGEILIADSDTGLDGVGIYENLQYSMLIQNLTIPRIEGIEPDIDAPVFLILEKA